MIQPRWLARFMAWFGGYFWMPCPICHEPFAGFEWGPQSLMKDSSSGTGVCSKPSCITEAALRNKALYQGQAK